MKIKLPIIFILIVIISFSNSFPIFAEVKGDDYLRANYSFTGKYQTDQFTGSVSYSYPIKIPKGTNDLTPELALNYNHSAARDSNQANGVGWQLTNDYIERDTNFTPTSTSDDKFKLHFKGATHDLVYVSSENRYHTKIESHLHITKITSGASNDSGEYWQVITPDGTKYRFGQASNSELICNGRSYVYRWNIDLVTDTHGNNIYYTYSESSGASYLAKVEYNTEKDRIVEFTYGSNPNQRQTYIQGCSYLEASRLNDIKVKINTTLIRQYELTYTTVDNNQQLLTSIVEKGNNGSALPATMFTYKSQVKTWDTTQQNWINNVYIDYAGIEKPYVALTDVNGDGLSDIVRTYNNDSNNTWNVFTNQGNSWNTTPQTWVNNANINAGLDKTNTRFLDVTGDNLPDIIRLSNTPGGDRSYQIYRNTGSSWNTTSEDWIYEVSNFPNPFDSRVEIVDVNGDNLPDVVNSYLQNGYDIWQVNKNLGGNDWDITPETWLSNVQIDAHLDQAFTKLIDVNGDNLADIVKSTYSGTYVTWYVWKNNGSSWSTTSEKWLDNVNVDAHLEQDKVSLADVNGDGLVDIVKGFHNNGLNSWKVLMNKGNGWATTWEAWVDNSSMDANVNVGRVRLTDVTGDGLADLVKSDETGGYYTWKVWKNNGYAPDLLSTVTTPQGGTVSFEYKPSTSYDNTGADSLSDLPFPMWLVEKKTENNGMTSAHQTIDVTTYSYQDGLYDSGDKEFRGFNTVTETASGSAKRNYVFNQDDILKGLLSEIQTRDLQNNPYAETENTWSSTTSNGVSTVKLDKETNYTYDGTASSPKVKETAFTYDTYGNITKQSEKGDTSTTSDDRFIYNEYAVNTTDWIVNTLRHTYTHKSDDSTKVAEKWLYYDNHTWIDDAPTKGDVTKEVAWLSGGTNPITLFTYDSYGNVTEETDANNHATGYAYDSATHTYPISTTNAKSQTSTTNYDLGTGNLLSKTDANGKTTSYEYDVFGRITKEIKPYDSSSYPTTNYQYFFDGTAPEGILVSKREVASTSGTLDVYTFIDGLERKIQTRADAEDTNNQTVTDTFYDTNGEVSKETVPYLATAGTSYATPLVTARSTEMSYDPLKRVLTIENPKGDTKTIAYDHWKETTVDENGHIKREFKNGFDKIVKVEEVNNGNTYTTTYNYDHNDQLTKITDNASNETTFTYDTLGRKTSQTDPDMGTWDYEYDGVGNLTKQTDNRDVEVTKTYDQLNRLTKTDYPNDTDTTYLYDAYGKIGTLTIATDSAGTVTYLYDERLRKTAEKRTVNGTTKTTQLSYDAADRTTTQINPDGEVVSYAFNPQGEIDSVTGTTGILSDIDYNALGKITSKDFANGTTTNYTYNTNDFRLNRIQTGSLQDLNYTYDNVGNIATITDNVASKTQTFTYDDLDRLATATESGGFNYAYQYNSIGNLTKFIKDGIDTDYTYGENNKPHALTSSTENASASAQTPALFSENWSSGSINTSNWTNWGSPQTSVVNGELKITSTTAANFYGVELITAHNLTNGYISNQLVSAGNQSLTSLEVHPLYIDRDGTFTDAVLFFVSGNTLKIQKRVNNSDTFINLGSYNSSTHKYFRMRENRGTMYFDTSANGTTWTNLHSFSNPFNLTSVKAGIALGTGATEASTTHALFDNFAYSIFPINSLTDEWTTSIDTNKWNDNGGSQTNVVSSQLKIDSTTASNYYTVESIDTYNLVGAEITNQLVNAGNQSITSLEVYPIYIDRDGTFTDAVLIYVHGNQIKIQKRVNNVDTFTTIGSYNSSTHKYFKIKESGGTLYFETSANGISWTTIHSFANPFTLTSVKMGIAVGTYQNEGSTTNAIFDNFNVLPPQNPTYTYDANGNMTSDGKNCYEYNESNQMKKAKKCSSNETVAEYIYDFKGNRMVKKNYTSGTLNNTVVSWSDSYESKIIEGGATENTAYYFANGQLLAKKDKNGNKTYFHNDHLGSTRVVTNQAGSLVESTSYDPWGEIKDGGTASKFLYTGQEHDSETKLHYYNARYYDPHIRRFTQPDTIVQNMYDPQYFNRYSYVRNNPLKYTDPTGHINEILAYNNALNAYYKKPSAKTYNNILTTARDIQKNNYQPEKDKETKSGGVQAAAKPAYNAAKSVVNFFMGEELKTIRNSNATLGQKSLAGISIAGAFVTGEIKLLKRGFKAAEEGIKASKKFNPDQAALIDLAKEAKRKGVNNTEADTLLQWADEYNIKPALDHRSPANAAHWDPLGTGEGISHIRIGSQNHIEVR